MQTFTFKQYFFGKQNKKMILKLAFIFFLCSCNILLGENREQPQNTSLVAQDAAWCWFSDPRAVYYKGEREAIYFGFINSKGDVVSKSINLENGQSTEYTLHERLEVDDHNVPTFLFLPDGKLLAFYNHHNGDIFMRKSKHAESISEWEPAVKLLKKDSVNRYCYTNPIMLSEENNRIYLFGRNIVRNKKGTYNDTRIYCIYSDDYGSSWSNEVNLLDNSGRNNPQYVKFASDNKSRIDFLFTNGHPKLGKDISVHHMYYQDGFFKQTDGDKIKPFDELPVAINETDMLYDAKEGGVRAWIWDIALDKNNNPVVTYARYPDEKNHEYYYAKWNGKDWLSEKLINSGSYITIIKPDKKLREAHYSGGVVLDHSDPTNVYFSANINGKFEIVKCKININGDIDLNNITENSNVDNIRPYVVDRNETGKPIVMWMSGNYYHYTDYDTDLRLKRY